MERTRRPDSPAAVERDGEHSAARELLERGLREAGTTPLLIDPAGEPAGIDVATEALLRRFFGGGPGRGLPAALREWLARERDWRPPLVVEDGRGGRLSLRVVECARRPGWRALLLDEWGDGPAPGKLRALGLTARQAEVLAWAARGRSDAAIGARLGISPRTVGKHLEHAYRRLGASGRAEAVTIALRASGR